MLSAGPDLRGERPGIPPVRAPPHRAEENGTGRIERGFGARGTADGRMFGSGHGVGRTASVELLSYHTNALRFKKWQKRLSF